MPVLVSDAVHSTLIPVIWSYAKMQTLIQFSLMCILSVSQWVKYWHRPVLNQCWEVMIPCLLIQVPHLTPLCPGLLPDSHFDCVWPFHLQLESSCVAIHELMKTVTDSQTRYRLREAQDRTKAEDLLKRVTFWSIGETVLLFLIGVGQVMMLRSFFADKRGSVAATT